MRMYSVCACVCPCVCVCVCMCACVCACVCVKLSKGGEIRRMPRQDLNDIFNCLYECNRGDYNILKLVWHLSDHMYKWSAAQGKWTDIEISLLVYRNFWSARWLSTPWIDQLSLKFCADFSQWPTVIITSVNISWPLPNIVSYIET